MHFSPAPDIQRGADRHQCHADCRHDYHQPDRRILYFREDGACLRIEHQRSDDHAHDDHGMQANHAPLEKLADRHAAPAVVISVSDDEARQDKEEVHS
jgi:hypothetical protein